MKPDQPLTRLVTHMYRMMLFLYPASFRKEFGREMVLVFRDISRDEYQKHGTGALFNLWVAYFFDLFVSAFVERAREVYTMSQSNIGRLAGLGGIFAGLLWLAMVVVSWNDTRNLLDESLEMVGIVCVLLVLVTVAALYFQGNYQIKGTLSLALLAVGTVILLVSLVLYVLNFDNDDGAAFGAFFISTIVMGLGFALVGFQFRAESAMSVLGKGLVISGILLAVTMSGFFIVFGLLPIIESIFQIGDFIWYSTAVLQGVNFLLVSGLAVMMSKTGTDRPVQATG